jgi:hypothetical protein
MPNNKTFDEFVEEWTRRLNEQVWCDTRIEAVWGSETKSFIRDLCRALTERHKGAIEAIPLEGIHAGPDYGNGFNDAINAVIRALEEDT